jgi:methylmalonyl-CoA epimerase
MSSTKSKASLNHIGIAVENLPQLRKLFSLLGLEIGHVEAVPEQGVRAHFVTLPREEGHLEFLEVTDPSGTVSKFIQKRGPGIHHLSFLVERGQLDPLCKTLRDEGYQLTYEAPKAGAHQMRINFIHPASAGGMLIEIMEPA